jgi:hypothetical protein
LRNHILKLQVAGREDGLDLLSHLSQQKQVKLVVPETIPRVQPQKDLQSLTSFSIRFLVEGLVTHGIVMPSEVPELISIMNRACPTLALKERVLTALFNEERVRHLARLVEGECTVLHMCNSVES